MYTYLTIALGKKININRIIDSEDVLECTNCCNSPKIHKSFFWVIQQSVISKADPQWCFQS